MGTGRGQRRQRARTARGCYEMRLEREVAMEDGHTFAMSRRAALAVSAIGVGTAMGRSTIVGALTADDVPWIDEVIRLPAVAEAGKLRTLLVADSGQPIGDLSTWQRRRRQLMLEWYAVLGTLPPRPRFGPMYETISNETVDGIERRRIRYETLPGETTEAYLLRPRNARGKLPAAVAFHSTVPHSIHQPAGVKGAEEKAFGWHLARRGFVALCPRNYLWPDNEHIEAKAMTDRFHEKYPQTTGMARMLWETRLAVDLLANHVAVDPRRIGAVGHSLGAKEVLYLAAFDDRIRAAVSSEGGIGLTFSNWNAPWYLGKQIEDPAFVHDHHELLALVAPRPFLLVGGDSADGSKSVPYVTSAQQVYRLFGKPVRLGLYRHGKGHAVPPTALSRSLEWLTTYVAH